MVAELARRTAEMDSLGATALDYAVDWIESGKTLRRLTEEMSDKTGHEFSRASVGRYLESLAPDAARRLETARRAGAHALVDDALEIVDATEGEESREAIASAKLRADQRTWTAERWNRDDLGQRQTTQVNVTIAALHIDALRRRATATATIAETDTRALPASEAEDVTIEESAQSGTE